jgi:CheY-like chemotaxis protein
VIVERNLEARLSGAKQLRGAGFRVLEARDGGEAFILLAAYTDVIVVVADLDSLGSGNGVAISEWLARDRPHLPVLLGPSNLIDRIVALVP